MAEQSGFFDAHLINGEYDRVYLAENFAKYFASFISNGVFGGKSNELMVKESTAANMSVKVLPGQAWINGYWYENTDELTLNIDVADGVLHRIDAIVLRWDNVQRVIRLAVKKGTPSSVNPYPPVIQRDSDYYELKIAQVYISAGTTKITQANIVDMRLNTDSCGVVVGVVDQFDTEEFGAQLNSYIEQFEANSTEWLNNFKTTSINSINNLLSTSRTEFNTFMTESREEIDQLTSELETLVDSNEFALLNEKVANILSRVVTLESSAATFKTDIAKCKTDILTNATNISNLTKDVNTLKTDTAALKTDNSTNKTNIANLTANVNKLNKLFVESGPNPGCFYRITSTNENEWINPPNEVGIEYRTTERWNGKPVYQRTYFIATLPNKTVMGISAEVNWDKVISVDGFAFSDDDMYFYPFPIILNGLTPVAVISNVEGDGGAGVTIVIQTNEDLSYLRGYITIKYTKT